MEGEYTFCDLLKAVIVESAVRLSILFGFHIDPMGLIEYWLMKVCLRPTQTGCRHASGH